MSQAFKKDDGTYERELFEQKFPVPKGVKWSDSSQMYSAIGGVAYNVANHWNIRFEAWQAARTQGGQGAEAVADWSNRNTDTQAGWVNELLTLADHQGNIPAFARSAMKTIARGLLNTQLQPAVPEGWRECLQEMVQAMHDYEMNVDENAPHKHRAMMDRAHALLSTPTTHKADGCPECGSTDLTWHTQSSVTTGTPDGKLRANEVSTLFVLGCGHCSETIKTLTADQVAENMSPQPPAGQEGA